ncbi:DUF3828 domain-containing protein [Pararhizobium sp.]|uniref:DUF3828 domain-containing protein n=1 Tax=Pararhizobium sp. TaxID=1977563 RepID=UPI002718ADBE|nr:DUF3828 domain-containing protein [Pararhizobium sp.]MDO9419007.1 DUF3828 domain-containing protein [Pararhizobium sp.]
MRLPTILLGLLLAALPALPAMAWTHKTPEALLEALYSGKGQDDGADALTVYAPYFSDELLSLYRTDHDNTGDGEMGALEFDPVIAGQDGQASNVEIGTPIILDDTAEVEVTFENGEPVTLFYTLVKEHGGWKVNDIANQQGDNPWSLSEIFGGSSSEY